MAKPDKPEEPEDYVALLRGMRSFMKDDKGRPVGVAANALWVPACGSIDEDDEIVRCECGRYRATQRPHGFKK